jgi:hypothetical protein
MVLQNLMKKPIIAIAFLMLFIVYFQMTNKKMNPTSCSATLSKLIKDTDKNWKYSCDKDQLSVSVINETIKYLEKDQNKFKIQTYRELANLLTILAQKSPDNLDRVQLVKLTLVHAKIELTAFVRGSDVYKLRSLTNPEFIANHFKTTVQVKEVIKQL